MHNEQLTDLLAGMVKQAKILCKEYTNLTFQHLTIDTSGEIGAFCEQYYCGCWDNETHYFTLDELLAPLEETQAAIRLKLQAKMAEQQKQQQEKQDAADLATFNRLKEKFK